jgi:uncharacterized protein (TIRG00374 family)
LSSRFGVVLRILKDWRVWVGVLLPIAAIAFTLRGVDVRQVVAHIGDANPWLVLAMVPLHVLALYLRALRWRWLARSLSERPLPIRPLFRATALGFMAINVLPLRLGELARPWLLGRETEVRGSAALGTLVLERAIDFTAVALMGGIVLFVHTKTMPGWVRSGAAIFALSRCFRWGDRRAAGSTSAACCAASRGLRPFPQRAAA